MANPFVHVELNSTDLPRAKKFYSKLFDWKFGEHQMAEGVAYTTIDVGKGTGGGMLKQLMPDTPSNWMPYVLVDDIKAMTAKAEKLGANVCKGVTDVMGMGRLSILTDPAGALFGLWEPKPTRAAVSAHRRVSAKRPTAHRRAARR